MKRTTTTGIGAALLMTTALGSIAQTPVGNAFTYQGKLTEGGAPANGQYDLTFRLYTAPNALFAIGNPVALENVPVTGGLFTVPLDFGSQFNGDARWLGVFVRPGASTGSFTALSPRQEITPAPYAIAANHLNLPLIQTGASDPNIFFDSGLLQESGVASRCGARPATPTTNPGTVAYRTTGFSNTSSSTRCVTVVVHARRRAQLFSAAYLRSFDPKNAARRYLGDAGRCTNTAGAAGASIRYSFRVPAQARFAVEVEPCNPSNSMPPYTVQVSEAPPRGP